MRAVVNGLMYVLGTGCQWRALPKDLPDDVHAHRLSLLRDILRSAGEAMIRYRVKELIADKEFQEGRRITIDEIARSTGIHRATLSKILNQPGYNTSTEVLEKLCVYFGVGLGAVAEIVRDQAGSDT